MDLKTCQSYVLLLPIITTNGSIHTPPEGVGLQIVSSEDWIILKQYLKCQQLSGPLSLVSSTDCFYFNDQTPAWGGLSLPPTHYCVAAIDRSSRSDGVPDRDEQNGKW